VLGNRRRFNRRPRDRTRDVGAMTSTSPTKRRRIDPVAALYQ